jgi:DNA invertase Pin-like site-specific DNA recombinase
MECEKFVGLVRVSTAEQGESRLGLEAGLADLQRYVKANEATLVTVLEEVASGGGNESFLIDRPTLLKALTLCKRHKACLLVPKVDRLVRSTCVHTDIKRSGVPFRAVDNPHANEFTLDIMVAVAAQERRAISVRTRQALAIYKKEKRVSKRTIERYGGNVPREVVEATAGKLGSHLVGCHLTAAHRAEGRAKGNAKQARESLEVYDDLVPTIRALKADGLSLRAIAGRLNGDGHCTRTGKPWGQVQVMRVLDRL